MTKEEEITKNMSLIEYYKEQLNQLDMQIQYLQAAMLEYHKAKMTVEQLHNKEQTKDILIPIGGGTYLNGSVTNSSKVLVNIGAGIVTEKTIDDAINKIDTHIKQVQENQDKILQMAQEIQTEIAQLSEKTQTLMEENKA